ncbi:MAG: hypothetical protein IT359_19670 [Gemmatimonadaceae bacterium]|nr:hypothetical protein [Gemmatimonadaceae bacterium]
MTTTLVLAFSMATGVAYAQAPAAPAPAPTAQVDARFANWLGCWRLEDDPAGTGARLCITPDTPGVRLQTVISTVDGGAERLQADGITRPISDQECAGTERAEWSRDGQRLFRRTEVTCGTEPARTVSSIAFLNPGPSWINVQLVEGGGDRAVRVQRYRRAFNQTLADGSPVMQVVVGGMARTPTADDMLWNVADVIEASAKMPAEAVQAAIAEAKGRFDLNKKSLVALADAGVSETVIDLMIGLAFPQRFVVERRSNYGSSAPVGISMAGSFYDPFLSPFLMGSAFADCYGYSGYGYRSYYSACGSMYSPYYNPLYGNYGYGNYYGNYYPSGWVSVNPAPEAGTAQVEGRVVNGRGYTQVRPRESEPIRTGSNDYSSSAGRSGASSGGTSGVSSQGYSGGSTGSSSGGSSGSSSDSGARTAVPRPPGGGF